MHTSCCEGMLRDKGRLGICRRWQRALMGVCVCVQAAIVKGEEAKAQEKADAAKAIKDECEADLAVVGGPGEARH